MSFGIADSRFIVHSQAGRGSGQLYKAPFTQTVMQVNNHTEPSN